MRDVAFSCDDGGSDFLRVAVWSLLEHYAGDEPIRVNVFEGFGGHSAAHKAALAEVVSRFPKATLRYHDVEPYLEPYPDIVKGRENSRWNIFTWTPIFAPASISLSRNAWLMRVSRLPPPHVLESRMPSRPDRYGLIAR